jgi:hypothetical protein
MRIDWEQFDRDEQFRHYFRYRLHENDFGPATDGQGGILGHFYAKPLYGRLDDRGRVDKSAGFNGEIAIAFAEPDEGRLTLYSLAYRTKRSSEPTVPRIGRRSGRRPGGGSASTWGWPPESGGLNPNGPRAPTWGAGMAEPLRPEWCLRPWLVNRD